MMLLIKGITKDRKIIKLELTSEGQMLALFKVFNLHQLIITDISDQEENEK